MHAYMHGACTFFWIDLNLLTFNLEYLMNIYDILYHTFCIFFALTQSVYYSVMHGQIKYTLTCETAPEGILIS